jgi:hypothetical protein
MKNQIINWIKFDRQFKTGLALYMQQGVNLALKTTFNRQGETPYNLAILTTELSKLANIHPDELAALLCVPVANYKKQNLHKIVVAEIPLPAVPSAPILPVVNIIPEIVLKSIRLREEFPFLGSKDCPDLLKVLVADMLTAYDNYKAAHEALFTCENEEQMLENAKATVDNYLENRLIWDELNHYKAHHEVLAKHPIFEEKQEILKIEDMNGQQLSKEKVNLYKAIGRLRKLIEKGDKPELNFTRCELIDSKERLLDAVNKQLENR